MQRGIELAQQKHFDAAVEEFGKAIQANPNDSRGYANRGTASRQAARVPWQRAIRKAPQPDIRLRWRIFRN